MEPIKIYPTAEELSKNSNVVHCPEPGCVSVFKSDSNLNLHLAKTHKKPELLKRDPSVTREYHCPEMKCVYHRTKYFKSIKLLKQHYTKVHSEKMYECSGCKLKFPTVSAHNIHVNFCGIEFCCCTCKASYGCYESLVTHARRKNHSILDKYAYKGLDPLKKSSSTTLLNTEKKGVVKSSSLHDVNSLIPKNTLTMERSSQTDIYSKTRQFKSRQVNQQETQTHNKCLLTAETQTIGDYFRNSKLEQTPSLDDFQRKDNKTQTKPVDSTTKSCNTSFNLDDFDFTYERSSSSTQTMTSMPSDCDLFFMQTEPFAEIGEFMHSSSQTSFHEDTFDSENYFNCSAETQTDLMSILDQDYTNMCTQTGEVFDDLNEFINSHTQTVSEDILRSVESQTMMSTQNNKIALSCRDMAHMETQTEEFKQLLEEINA